MTANNNLIAIYDFEFFPYALGDVLTWNIRTAMRCEEYKRDRVDIYLCLDEENPASIYQRGLVNPDNYDLFFSELYGAFGTNPKLGNLYIFRQREALIAHLEKMDFQDNANKEAIKDYLNILKHRVSDNYHSRLLTKIEKKIRTSWVFRKILKRFIPVAVKDTVRGNLSHEFVLNRYFIKYVYSHESINQFYTERQSIPLLQASLGCTPDVEEIIAQQFEGKKIVPFHLRLRRLDVGYGGDHSYARDSDFLEWYRFLKEAAIKHPDVQFVALGRLQEKPLEILRLPNVTSLRIHGMGLGHELTLMLKSHLFIGSSSGFAALANFSNLPYFITRMNPGSCHAYAIDEGADRLPFAKPNQKLIYAQETAVLLMQLLETGLNLQSTASPAVQTSPLPSAAINLRQWMAEHHQQPFNSARTTCRFYINDQYRHEETAYLLLPYFEQIRQFFIGNHSEGARNLLQQVHQCFPELCQQFIYYYLLQGSMAVEDKDLPLLQHCIESLDKLPIEKNHQPLVKLFKDSLAANTTSLLDVLKKTLQGFNFAEVPK